MKYKKFVALATSAIGLISFSAHAGITETASLSNSGAPIAALSDYMTRNGRYVIFTTLERAVPEDINLRAWDVYIRDLEKDVTELVSVNQGGVATGMLTTYSATSVSADGRFVVFSSRTSDIVPNDTNSADDIFIRDREKKTTERVTMTYDGGQVIQGNFYIKAVSDDGRYILYNSDVPNIVPNDTDNSMDVFLYDREKKVTERLNQNSQGIRFHGGGSRMSADARYIMIGSGEKLVPNDYNSRSDAYVKDRVKNTFELVSVSSTGQQGIYGCGGIDMTPNGRYYLFSCEGNILNDAPATGNLYLRDIETKTTVRATSGVGDSWGHDAAISADGRFVGYMSASRLVAEDTNTAFDVYLYDREKKQNQLISVATNGAITEDWSAQRSQISISADGQKVMFTSNSKNLGAPAPQISGFLSYVRNTQFGCF